MADAATTDIMAAILAQYGDLEGPLLPILHAVQAEFGYIPADVVQIIADHQLDPECLIAVQKPYMERRTFAALEVQWPELVFSVTSPQLSLSNYCTETITPRLVVEAMVGDFPRILDYPALGYATEQVVPPDVRAAFALLVDEGYTAQLA